MLLFFAINDDINIVLANLNSTVVRNEFEIRKTLSDNSNASQRPTICTTNSSVKIFLKIFSPLKLLGNALKSAF